MSLRSLLFSTDEQSAQPILGVLGDLGVEGEFCTEAAAAIEKLTHETFQIVLIDWDNQPEAGLLLSTARDRKPAERPLTLAIVSSDAGVPKALQAGANSILRKPVMLNQVKDTLKTARDLLRARQESAAAQAAAAAGAGPATLSAALGTANEPVLRAGEFLQSGGPAPATQFDIESDFQKSLDEPVSGALDPLKDLEPTAAAVSQSPVESAAPTPAPPAVPQSSEPRGLQWYLNQRKAALAVSKAAASGAAAPAPAPEKPELLGYDQTPSFPPNAASQNAVAPEAEGSAEQAAAPQNTHEQKTEEKLFAYIEGQGHEPEQKESAQPGFQPGKRAIVAAAILAGCAIVAAPQAPWHHGLQAIFARGQLALHSWLNPQPVTPTQAPASHENFARAGDEYKLPVAENIPDATTDPSQIRVTPVIDPTAKKPNNEAAANTDPTSGQADTTGNPPTDAGQTPQVQVHENQTAPGATAAPADAVGHGTTPANSAAAETAAPVGPRVDDTDTMALAKNLPPAPVPLKNPNPRPVSDSAATIPSSLKSQMAAMTPDASGNKPVEAALPSIEPVDVPEMTERGLLSEGPTVAYPESAKGLQGTVVLWVLIGRDGSVQDAKFLQGSLAFARAAIDGVKQWKFKPYILNGRPVSVQTKLTLGFKPGA